MKEAGLEQFERELKKLKPAHLPEAFLVRLAAPPPECARPGRSEAGNAPVQRKSGRPRAGDTATAEDNCTPAFWPGLRVWWRRLRWLVPAATAAVALAFLFGTSKQRVTHGPEQPTVARSVKAPLQADNVEIDQRLVAVFDAVARLPEGAPVRLRCQEWMDEVVLRDSSRGIIVEQRTPRLEIVPVSFETY